MRVDDGLKQAGVASEEELAELVGKFPLVWKTRAKQIAGKMLEENEAAVEQEATRYDYFDAHHGRDGDQAYDDIGALRLADREIAAGVTDPVWVEFPFGGPLPAITFEGLQGDVEKGSPQPDAASDADQAKTQKAVYERKVSLLAKWRADGLEFAILFHPSYRPGYLDASGDENILKLTGQWAAETKKKITNTRENIDDETIALWDLRDVPDLTFESLGVPRDSVLGKAVEKEYADRKADEAALREAAESFALTVTVVATAVAGPVGLAVGAVAQGAVSAVGLGHDVAQAQAQADAQGVALDPDFAKLSQDDPDLFSVLNDLIALGMAATDALTAAKGLKSAVVALEASGDKGEFIARAHTIVGDKATQLADRIEVRALPEGLDPGLRRLPVREQRLHGGARGRRYARDGDLAKPQDREVQARLR